MNKVYTYPQKIFKSIAALAIVFGVTSCATSQSTAASSGETDGIYYSPSKDGQIEYVSSTTPEDYEIKVGGAYFDANGNGAEEFYYEEAVSAETQNVNVSSGSGNMYAVSGSTDWGRYEGVDITVNNWGWNNPWMMGWGYGFNNWGWGMGWNSWGMGWGMGWNSWGFPRWGWHNPYWGFGGGWGFNHWGWGGHPYYGGGYYGGHYGNSFFNRSHRAQSGVRPGSNLAYSPFNSRRTGLRDGNVRNNNIRGLNSNTRNSNVRATRNENVRNNGNVRNQQNDNVRNTQSNVRPVRTEQPVRSNNNISTESGVRPTRTEGNIRTNNPVRPVRATVPPEVRQNNAPTRTNNNQIRTNRTNPNRNVSPQRNTTPSRSNQGIRTSPNRGSNSGGIRSGGGSPSRGSGGGGMRSGGGRR